MAIDISNIVVKVDVAEVVLANAIVKDLANAADDTSAACARMDKAFSDAAKAMSDSISEQQSELNIIKDVLVNYSTAASKALVDVGTAIFDLTMKTGLYANEMLLLEQSTGLTADTLQELAHIAVVAGMSSEGLFDAITHLSDALPEIAQGAGMQADALDKL